MTRVPTVDAMEVILPTWADPSVPLGPNTDVDPETEVVRPRISQLVPGKYVSLIIHRRRIKAKVAYQEILGALRADGALEACADVVTWLRAACTSRGGGGAQNAVPCVLHALTRPIHLPPEVNQYVTLKVRAGDLPGIRPARGPLGTDSTASLVRALRALTRRDGEEGMRWPCNLKTIAEAYKETHHVLLCFWNMLDTESVAPVWLEVHGQLPQK